MERDKTEKSLHIFEKQNIERDKLIAQMKQQFYDFEQQKLEFIESEEELAKLYHMGIVDDNGEYL